jgi:hypothetical protein
MTRFLGEVAFYSITPLRRLRSGPMIVVRGVKSNDAS